LHDSIEVRFRAFVVHAQDIGSNIEEAFRIQEQLRWAGDDHTALVNDTDQGNRILRYVPQLKAELEDAYNIWSWQDAEDAQEELVETVGVMHPALRQQAFMELSISQTARTNI
jgi:hypothetical protein